MRAPRLDLDFSDPAIVADPFPAFERIRAAGRVVCNEALGGWMLPGWDECAEVFSDGGERFAALVRARFRLELEEDHVFYHSFNSH